MLILRFLFACILIFAISSCESDDPQPGETWQIIQSTKIGRQPVWSPDGNLILFGDDTPGQSGIYLWDLLSEPTLLTDNLPPHNWDYCWSSNGQDVAFTSPGAVGDTLTGVWIYSLSDDALVKVFDRGRELSWLHNEQCLLVRVDNPEGNVPGIFKLAPDTLSLPQNPPALWTATLLFEDGLTPDCSPADQYIAYNDNELNGRLHIADRELNDLYISKKGVIDWSWSKDGTHIAFIINNYLSGSLENILLRLDINHPEAADTLTRWASNPASNQNGSQIAFTRLASNSFSDLWLFRNGEDVLRISDYGLNADFHPTGDSIAVHSTVGGIRVLTRFL